MSAITRAALLEFLRGHRYAVQSSTHPTGAPQSAVVGIAVSDDFEVVFDTIDVSRKATNLRRQPAIAFVFGGLAADDERTVQYEGVAAELTGADRERLTALYFAVFPDGRDRLAWPGLVHVKATPTWLRYSDFSRNPPQIEEFDRAALGALK